MAELPPVLDATCGGRMMWFNKQDPRAIYCDCRNDEFTASFGANNATRHICVSPDLLCDFTNLPFPDNSFYLVVFDPPHLVRVGAESWTIKAYGRLPDDWKTALRAGFQECMRVLRPGGTLIFKWSDVQISSTDVIKALGSDPLFGHRSGKKMNTHWMAFMKEANNA